jgi:integrase
MTTLGIEGLGMTSLKLAYIKRYENPKGVWRHYFNKRGRPSVALPGLPGSEEFMEAYQACLKAIPAAESGPKAPRVAKGSMSDLIARYYASSAFKGLKSDVTKSTYRNEIKKIDAEHGAKPVALLDRRGVKKMLAEKADRPGAANKLLRTIKMLMKFAIDDEMRSDDPTAGIKPLKVAGDGFIAWTEGDIEKFEAKFPIGTKPRLALALALYTAQRRGDIVRMHRQHVRGDKIAVRQQKTGAYLDIPIHPELEQIIKASVPSVALVADGQSLTFLVSETGQPFKPASFGNWFGDRCREAGLPLGYNAHGLRKASARRLAEAGCTTHEIMAITGHQSIAEVERYTKSASQQKMSVSGMEKLRQRSNENKE